MFELGGLLLEGGEERIVLPASNAKLLGRRSYARQEYMRNRAVEMERQQSTATLLFSGVCLRHDVSKMAHTDGEYSRGTMISITSQYKRRRSFWQCFKFRTQAGEKKRLVSCFKELNMAWSHDAEIIVL